MAKVRLNKVIELLERGQTVFSCGTIPNGNYDDILAVSRSAYDMTRAKPINTSFKNDLGR